MTNSQKTLIAVVAGIILLSVTLLFIRNNIDPGECGAASIPTASSCLDPLATPSVSLEVEALGSPQPTAVDGSIRFQEKCPAISMRSQAEIKEESNLISKRFASAYRREMQGDLDEALELYRAIAEESRGSEQIGALHRYMFTIRRKQGLKSEVDRLKTKINKTDFEWMLLSQFGSEVDPCECYREVIADASSPFVRYAKMKLAFHYNPLAGMDVKTFARKAAANLQAFINESPEDPFVAHAELRIASCWEELGDNEAAIDIYRRLCLEKDDILIRTYCIDQLFKHGQVTDTSIVEQARQVPKFFGILGNGYFMPEDFDPEDIAIDMGALGSDIKVP